MRPLIATCLPVRFLRGLRADLGVTALPSCSEEPLTKTSLVSPFVSLIQRAAEFGDQLVNLSFVDNQWRTNGDGIAKVTQDQARFMAGIGTIGAHTITWCKVSRGSARRTSSTAAISPLPRTSPTSG